MEGVSVRRVYLVRGNRHDGLGITHNDNGSGLDHDIFQWTTEEYSDIREFPELVERQVTTSAPDEELTIIVTDDLTSVNFFY